ncbi:MAG: hypothetical protein NZ765_05065 [Anaerolineae bacterium]|nr:hypothetical protein [Anaerolineae bacterium]MDW8070975.1 hypothetical protein [Anaerolineae bacterium]
MKGDTAKKLGTVLLASVLGLALLLAMLLVLTLWSPQPAQASTPVKTGYVVVRFGAHNAMVRAFTFTTSISSYVALQRAGVNPAAANTAWGLFLCSIAGVGRVNSTGDNCDNGTFFWSTWYWDGTQWTSYMVGVGDSVITQDGHIDGYVWTDQWPAPEPPYGPGAVAVYRGLEWLRGRQDANTGGYGTPNDTIEALYAVTANHYDPAAWRRGADKPSLLAAGIGAAATLSQQHGGGAGKASTALAAVRGCRPVTMRDIMSYYDATTGRFNPNDGYHAWAMIGLRALSQTVPYTAVQALKNAQKPDGGWAFGTWSNTSDTNATALAIQALIAAGEPVTSTAVVSGLNYLDNAQKTDGGFPYDPQSPWGTDSDTNSTAYVVQALVAAGEDPTKGRWKEGDNHPLSYLVGMQLANGAFEWQKNQGANQLATQQAIPALLYRPFPFAQATLERCPGAAFLPVIARR